MRAYFKMTAVIAVILFIGISVFVVLTANGIATGKSGFNGEISALNDIARTAEQNESNLSILDDKAYNMNFVIVDMTENVLYSHSSTDIGNQKLSVQMAIQNRYPYIYLKNQNNDKIWGCLIELDDGSKRYNKAWISFIIGFSIFSAIVIMVMIGYGLYINKNIIIPFASMKSFAAKVAIGKLDEPLEMDKGNMFGAFTESFDIMREELAASKQRELALQKKERELVASLSHDLKTPVTGIKLAAELMQMRLSVKTNSGDKLEKHHGESGNYVFSEDEIGLLNADVDGIRRKAGQIDALLSDLFTSTLDDLGEFKVSCQDEESGILGDIVGSFDDRGLAVMESIPAAIINIDAKRMSQVIGNIISNSYKYAGTRIDIAFSMSRRYLEMQIRDHGPGVPPGEIDLITNKFYRGRDWENTDKDGHGLGLYISKTLMKMMNGDLIAESDGEGLSITLIIPLS